MLVKQFVVYLVTTREEMLEFGDTYMVEHKLIKHELRAAERDASVQAGDVAKVAHMDARDEDHRWWKAYHHSVRKVRAKDSKANNVS